MREPLGGLCGMANGGAVPQPGDAANSIFGEQKLRQSNRRE
jgi:hypothetical protein